MKLRNVMKQASTEGVLQLICNCINFLTEKNTGHFTGVTDFVHHKT